MPKCYVCFSNCSIRTYVKSACIIMLLNASLLYPGEVSKPKIGFYKDNIYLQIGGGNSRSAGGYHKIANQLNADIDTIFSDTSDYINYYYAKTGYNKPHLNHGSIKTFRLEYGLSNNFGIGINFRRTTYFISNFNTTNMHQSIAYSWLTGKIPQGREASVISSANVNYLMTKEKIRALDAITGHAVFSYHMNPNSVLDSYIHISIGTGENYSNVAVSSGFLTFGARYFFYPYLFLYGELEGGAIQVSHKNHNFWGRDLPFGTLYEASFQIGIGASGWEEEEVLAPVTVKKETPPEKNKPESKPEPPRIMENKPSQSEEPVSIQSIRNMIIDLQNLNLEDVELTIRENKVTVIFLHDLLFPIGSDIIHVKGENEIKIVTQIFNKYPEINFLIEGHTDDTPFHKKTTGKFKNNFELSESRAWEVHHIMRESKLSVVRLKCIGYGESKPRRPNNTSEDRRLNRRIEIVADKDLSEYPEITKLLKR